MKYKRLIFTNTLKRRKNKLYNITVTTMFGLKAIGSRYLQIILGKK